MVAYYFFTKYPSLFSYLIQKATTKPTVEDIEGSVDGNPTDTQQELEEEVEEKSSKGRKRKKSTTSTDKTKGKKAKKSKPVESDSSSSSEEESDPSDQQTLSMFSVPNEPLTSHVDAKVIKAIRKGKYIDIGKLKRKDVEKSGFDEQVIMLEDGALKIKDPTALKIVNFGPWLDVFLIYMTIRGKQFPGEMLGMLKHIETVKRLCAEGCDGMVYDQRFRQLKANFGAIPWGQFMPEFVTVRKPGFNFVTRNDRNMSRNFIPSNMSRNNMPMFCKYFNTGNCRQGNKCSFKHLCSLCRSHTHGAKQCPK